MLLQFVVLSVLKVCLVAQTITIPSPLGDIEGSTELTTRLGRQIYAFRGIRYAEAPRFQAPVPIGAWNGTYNATVDGAICPQSIAVPIAIQMAEDCLFLNVYTTKLPDKRTNPRRPVIVYFHGGSFVVGAGHSAAIGPQNLLDKDVVLVTFNYRLGTLGFLAVNKEVPGNNGLRDQVVALRWVKNNIKAFGGDPNSVTLYGFSAGACSVNLHLVSKMSKDLFHRAFLASGTLVTGWPLPSLQVALAQKQARLVGCPDDTPEVIVDCLRNKPVQEIVDTTVQFLEFGTHPIIVWSPVIEEDFGQTRFLAEHPIKSIVSGNFEQVPTLAGVTRDEFASAAIAITEDPELLQKLNDDFDTWAPVIFLYERNSTRSKQISDAIRHYYFNDQPITNASLTKFGEAFADSIIGFGVNRLVNLVSAKSWRPVFYYEFTYDTTNQTFGVDHGKDQGYAFPSFLDAPSDPKMIDRMITFIFNFAVTGNPNIPKIVDHTYWKEYNRLTERYLDIGQKLVLRDHLFEDRYRFWENLFPISSYL